MPRLGRSQPFKPLITRSRASMKFAAALALAGGTFAETGGTHVLNPGISGTVGGFYVETGGNALFSVGTAFDGGSFAETGGAASLAKGNRIFVDGAAYTLGILPVTLKVGLNFPAGSASYAEIGFPSTLTDGLVIASGGGSYVVTVGDVSMILDPLLTVTGGSFAETGGAALFTASLKPTFGTNRFFFTGGTSILTGALNIAAGSASYTETGGAATLRTAIIAAGGSFAETGGAINNLAGSQSLSATGGSFVETGAASVLATSIVALGGSYVETGGAQVLTPGMLIAGGSYVDTGGSTALGSGIVLAGGSYVETGGASVLKTAMPLLGGSFAETGGGVALAPAINLAIVTTSSTFNLTGNSVVMGLGMATGSGVFAETGHVSTLSSIAQALTVREAMISWLQSIAPLTAIVGTRIYLDNPSDIAAYPYLTIQLVDRRWGHTLAGADGTSFATFEICAISHSHATSVAMIEAIRDVADGFRGFQQTVPILWSILDNEQSHTTMPPDASELFIYEERVDYQFAHRVILPQNIVQATVLDNGPATLREVVVSWLNSITALTPLVGTRIYCENPSQEAVTPYILVGIPKRTYGRYLDGSDNSSDANVSIKVLSHQEATAVYAAEAIRNAADGFRGAQDGVAILNCLLVDESDSSEPPIRGLTEWIYTVESEYRITHRVPPVSATQTNV